MNSPKQKFKNEKLVKTPSRKSQMNTNNNNNVLIKNNTLINSLQMSTNNFQNNSKYLNSNITLESCNSFIFNNKERTLLKIWNKILLCLMSNKTHKKFYSSQTQFVNQELDIKFYLQTKHKMKDVEEYIKKIKKKEKMALVPLLFKNGYMNLSNCPINQSSILRINKSNSEVTDVKDMQQNTSNPYKSYRESTYILKTD